VPGDHLPAYPIEQHVEGTRHETARGRRPRRCACAASRWPYDHTPHFTSKARAFHHPRGGD
jgi:hypothetical protein